MSTRALTSSSIPGASFARSKHSIRIIACTVSSGHATAFGRSVHPTQVRMFCGRGWKSSWYNRHACHGRLRRETLENMARDYREQYILLNRMTIRKPGHYQFWQNWDDYSKQSRRWLRSGRRNNYGSEKRRDREHWHDELVRKIEADPYTFLFGKSNEYLQLPRSWSSFCRSFLDPEASPEQTRKTSPTKEHSERSSAFDVSPETSSEMAENKNQVKKSYTTSNRNEDLVFDPISGRMRPAEQSTIRKQVQKKSVTRTDSTASLSSESISRKASSTQVGKSPVSNGVLYMAGPTEDASVTLENQTKPTIGVEKQEIAQKKNIDQKQKPKQRLSYSIDEVKEDDVDLLRASDIRASFFAGPTRQEIAEKKKAAREALEQEYSSSSNAQTDINNEILRDLKAKKDIGFTTINKPTIKEDTVDASISQTLEIARQFIDDTKLLTHDILKTCERLEASAAPTDTFRVLAYDSVSSRIVFAETMSSMHTSEQIRHPAEVLLHINNPARFLPHFARMKADGYEIVSGGGDILIFRKTANEPQKVSAEIGHVKFDVLPSIDGKQSPIDDAMSESSQSAPKQRSPNSRIVRRQETVYTGGPPNWSPYPPTSSSSILDSESASTSMEDKQEQTGSSKRSSRLGRGIRRVILSGFATAGTFYAIGVVCEYFITGGQDGLGPEGFSEFEAERRRRE